MTTIFYIEDSEVERGMVKAILAPHFRVVLSGNGLDAIQKGKSINPDLVLTDLNMPGLDGYEVATRLKVILPDTPVVAFTGDDSEEARNLALIAGCDGVVSKNINPKLLLPTIRKYLAGYREKLPDSPEVEQETVAYQRRLVSRLESQVMALTQSNEWLKAVQRITQSITNSFNLDEIINATFDNLTTLLQFKHLAIYLRDTDSGTLTLNRQRYFTETYLQEITIPYHQAVNENVTHPVATPQIITNLPKQSDNAPKLVVRLPLIVKDRLMGMLYIGSDNCDPAMVREQVSHLELISWQLAIAVDNAQVYMDLQSAYREMQQLDELKNQFVMVASHELRTPLTLLSGYLYLLKKESVEQSQELLNIITSQADQLESVVDRILDVERLQHQDFLAEFVETDLMRVLQRLVETLAPMAESAGVSLEFEPPFSAFCVWIDVLKLEAILTNIIINAIRFSPSGQVVQVIVGAEGGDFFVSVTDRGIGIPQEEHDRIFEKFYQIQDPLKRTHGGVGLGLSIARDMAQLCGGDITLESLAGQGSTFTYRQKINVNWRN